MEHGIWAVLFLVTLIALYYWVERLHQGRLDDRQREIDRLAEDNREYRELFLRLWRDSMKSEEEEKK